MSSGLFIRIVAGFGAHHAYSPIQRVRVGDDCESESYAENSQRKNQAGGRVNFVLLVEICLLLLLCFLPACIYLTKGILFVGRELCIKRLNKNHTGAHKFFCYWLKNV